MIGGGAQQVSKMIGGSVVCGWRSVVDGDRWVEIDGGGRSVIQWVEIGGWREIGGGGRKEISGGGIGGDRWAERQRVKD